MGEPPEQFRNLRDTATEVLKQVLIANPGVSQDQKGKGKGNLAEMFDTRGKDTPSLKRVAEMIRARESTSPDTDGKLVAEVATALGFDKEEYANARRELEDF